jgi:MFS family permease
MLLSLGMFALGGALCGSAQNMSWLIAARTIQGAGGGSIQAVSSIIVSDLVPLNERAMYNSVIGLAFGVAAAVGPLIGGSLAKSGDWRWIFYLTLPVSGISATLVFVFLKLRIPPGSFKEKIGRMDWIGNAIVMASSTAIVIALTWGGIQFSWSSVQVLVPLILGLVGIAAWFIYEGTFATHPIVPYRLLSNRTSLSGYIQTFIVPIPVFATTYYLPSYYQACKGASPLRAGVLVLPITVVFAPVLIGAGISINITKAYRPQLVIGWCLVVLAMGVLSSVRADSPLAHPLGFSVLVTLGAGFIYTGTYFPVLAPLNVKDNAYALSFFAYCRQFAAIWGITIGGAILQNQLNHKLPQEFVSELPSGVALAYAAIPAISTLEEPVRSQVRNAFGDGFAVIWQVTAGISGIGLISTVLMKALRLHTEVDDRWGLERDAPLSAADIALKDSHVDVTVDTAPAFSDEGEPELRAHV